MQGKNRNIEQKTHFNKRFFASRFVILTSLPSFILAEVFFAWVYFVIVEIFRWIYIAITSIGSTAQIEANMQIFSPLNITIFFIALGIISIVMCIEIMTIMAITAYDYYRNDHIPLKTLMAFSWERFRTIGRIRSLPLVIFVFFFPKFHIGPSGLLALDIPPFIFDEIIKFPFYIAIIAIFLVAGIYLIYRSIFVLHYLFFERTTIAWAFSSSFTLTKKIGFYKMLSVIFVNIFWTFLFIVPILAFGVALSRTLDSLSSYFWDYIFILSDFIAYIIEFLFLGLSGALFLAGITIAYIKYAGFWELHFQKRFHFLRLRPDFTPRWHNVRMAFSKKYPAAIAAILIALTPLFLFVLVRATPYSVSTPGLISHRGVQDNNFTENTLEAILEAKYQGADMVEIDIYENKDWTLILSHDADLSRVAGINIKISELTNAEMQHIFLPNWEKIPTLEEVLILAKMRDIRLLIEPKMHGQEKNLLEELNRLLVAHDMVGQVEIQSLNFATLEKIRTINPHIRIGYVVFGGLGGFNNFLGVDFISLQETLATRNNIKNIRESEKDIYIWTVNNPSNIEKYMRLGADAIITDKIPEIEARRNQILSQNSAGGRTIFQLFGFEFSPDDWMNFWKKIFAKF